MKLGLHIPATTWEGGAGRLGSTLVEVVAIEKTALFGFDVGADGSKVSERQAFLPLGAPELSAAIPGGTPSAGPPAARQFEPHVS